uniref:Uncharacterized protein n=1 Tax=Anolis carolinensis TaxID=28377 RepID=G1KWA4_ANOCA
MRFGHHSIFLLCSRKRTHSVRSYFSRCKVGGKGGHQQLGALVAKPFLQWKNAIEIFNRHQKTEYHHNNLCLAENFLLIHSGKHPDVTRHYDKGNKKKAEENRKKLLPIVETIVLCGQQELALRGSQNSGPITLEEPLHNDGNFRALLGSRARSGNTDLKIHLKTAAMNAQYTSPQIQNELINICGEKLVQTIVDRCNASQCFSILADETLDVSTSKQLSLAVRYIDVEIGGIREDFIGFVKIHDMTGGGLGYDGAANMSGHISGAQAIVLEKYPKAVYIHCSAHSLNLALAKACSIPAVRNCQGTISSVCNFFRASSIRLEQLKKNIKDSFPESRAKSLLPLCETRWVERHDAVLRFVELYSVMRDSSQAEQLLFTVLNAGFVVTIHILRKLLSLSLQLSKTLQRVDVDIFGSLQYVDNLLEKAREMRTDSVKEFQEHREVVQELFKFLQDSVTLMEEYDMWCRKWKKIPPAEKPSNALEAYLVCDGQFFPNVKKLLQISATLPVSTAINERSFSTLKRLKTYTRSTMKQERLTGLALLSVHRSLSIEPDFCQSVLTQFSSVSNKRCGVLL